MRDSYLLATGEFMIDAGVGIAFLAPALSRC
jgi:hypothetical protein